jgi:predicted PurR-regulated permease PerM
MIDRFWYNFFAKMDDICEWIADRFKRKKMTRKTNTVLIGLLGTILMGLSTWVIITLVELQVLVMMIQQELMDLDKVIGRIYSHMDRLSQR